MKLRGLVLSVTEPTTVSTQHGKRELAEITLRSDSDAHPPKEGQISVTLWGKWAETAERLEHGMTVVVTEVSEDEYNGETKYATTGESYVVVEPDHLVTVTDIREWVQCPRQYYLSKLSDTELSYPLVKGSIVHELFGDLLRERDLETSIEDRVAAEGLNLGLLGRDAEAVEREVRQHASAIEGWLSQGALTETDEWRSEQTLISETFGMKGRADAVRRGVPVELKTGKNTKSGPRFTDKVQATCYALLLGEHEATPDTGTLLYTKNATVDRAEETGDLSPAKDFSIGKGLFDFVVRTRNELVAAEQAIAVPTGEEADAPCERCFVRDSCMVVAGRLDQHSKAGTVGEPVPADEQASVDRFYRAIEHERQAVHTEYRKLWTQRGTERAADDRALIDLDPLEQTRRDDGTWELRAAGTDAVSKIREGDVVLASDGHPTRGNAERARVLELGEEIVVTTDEPVELRRLDVYPSEYGLDGLLTAVHDAVLKGDPERKDILFGRKEPAFGELRTNETFIENNAAQNRAVELAVTAEDCALIQGPPGTGKTYTLARTVRGCVERGERVLLSAFTNRAVDNALEALREQGFTEFVRIGSEHSVGESMQDARLSFRGDPDDRVRTLRETPVVATTAATCTSPVLMECEFDVAVVDEASQLTEPGTLAAINRADRFVLVGDHQQLPPVVRAEDASERDQRKSISEDEGTDLSRSLFERLIERYPEASVMLERQYRMNQRVQYFSSEAFYDGKLRPATPAVASQRLDDLSSVSKALPEELRDAVAFIDPDGHQQGNMNPTEADQVAAIVSSYLDTGVDPSEIGVIAPFRAQVAAITQRVPDRITVDTVDRFQGSAREVIIVSFVATGSLDSPIFEDRRRVNVALTRAKKSLRLVGDEQALRSDPFYERMLDWAA